MHKATISGRVGSVKDLGKFTKVSIAVTEKVKSEERTLWFDCIAFGKTAENLSKFAQVGNKILVDGELSYNQKENIKYYNIIISNFEIMAWKKNEKPNDVEQKEAAADFLDDEGSYLSAFDDDNIPF